MGVNRFAEDAGAVPDLQRISEENATQQVARVRALRAERDQGAVDEALTDLGTDARGTANLLPPMKRALRGRATLGEVSDALRDVFGEYRPTF